MFKDIRKLKYVEGKEKKKRDLHLTALWLCLRRSVNTCKLNLNLEIYSVKNYGHFK